MSSGLNLAMTVVGFSFSVMFILFVCTRLICARIHLSAARRSRASSDPSMLERGLHGLDPLVLANFPTLMYREFRLSSLEIAQCVICLSEYNEEETLRVLPICGHWFHRNCIDKWLQQNSTCPVCRVSVRDSPERRWCMQTMFSSAVRSQQHTAQCTIHSAHHWYSSSNNASYNHQRANNRMHEEVTCRSEANEVSGGDNDNCVSGDYNRIIKDGGDGKVESQSSL